MTPSSVINMDDASLAAMWQPVAQAVTNQLSDLLGVRLVLGKASVVRGNWSELRAAIPVTVTAAEVALHGDCKGMMGLFWAAADSGAPEQWFNSDEVRLGLREAVTTGVAAGMSAEFGCDITLEPLGELTTGAPLHPIGLDPAANGYLLSWEAAGDGISFVLSFVVQDPLLRQLVRDGGSDDGGTKAEAQPDRVHARSPRLAKLHAGEPSGKIRDLDMIIDLPLRLTVEIGSTNLLIKDVLAMGEGSVVELNRQAGDPVDVLVNGKLLARGEIVVLPDGNFGVRVAEIISASDRLRNLHLSKA